MRFNGRLLVGAFGPDVDPHLLRYASMVSRFYAPAREADVDARVPQFAAGSVSANRHPRDTRRPLAPKLVASGNAEVRFVLLLPSAPIGRNCGSDRERSALRARVDEYFRASLGYAAVGCDVLRGRTMRRLANFAADFDSDLLILDDDGWPRHRCVPLAMHVPCSVWLVPNGWAPVLRRILVPVDFTDRSIDTLQTALELARRFAPASCVALHVDNQDTRYGGSHLNPNRERELLAKIERLFRRVHAGGVELSPLVVKGHSIENSISEAADRHAADLVVMATRGRTDLSGWLLPSATQAALEKCPSAFLVLKSANRPLNPILAMRERWQRGDAPLSS